MRTFALVAGTLVIAIGIGSSSPTHAESADTTLSFAVMRNGEQIGSSYVRLRRDGQRTIAEVATRVQVQVFGIPVYRFEQNETEHWADGRLLALDSVTNDNGATHR